MIRTGGAPLNIANGIREFARATPAALAVVDGDRSLTYSALDDRASRVANALLSRGLRRDDRVAFIAGNTLEYPEVACGLAKAGLVLVPVNPRLTPKEAAFLVGHSGSRAVVYEESGAAQAAESIDAHGVRIVLGIGDAQLGASYEEALDGASANDPRTEVAETDPFCIAYTSGTTANPKGVTISHRSRSLTFYGTALEWGLGPGRRTIAVAPMYHGAGFAFGYGALHVGGTLWILPAFDPDELLAMMASSRAQSVFLVPTHAQLVRARGGFDGFDLSALETLYFNAAPLPQDLKLWVMDSLPHVGLHELYGSTEAGIVSNLRPPDQRRKERCVGPPWLMTEVRLVDPDGNVLEAPCTGELYSRSPYLMNGYWRDPAATAACTTDDGFLTSGDVCHIDDEGYLYVVDRVKDMIITGGINVYPREIEDVLRAHESVEDVAVVGAPSEVWGEEVTAIVVLASGAALDEQALDAHCRVELANFKVPRRYTRVEALPRNAAGKVLKRELRERVFGGVS